MFETLLPLEKGHWLHLVVESDHRLSASRIRAYIPPWPTGGSLGERRTRISIRIEIRDAVSLGRPSGMIEKIEHFPGSWLFKIRNEDGVLLYDANGNYLVETVGAPIRDVRIVRRLEGPSSESLLLRIARDLQETYLRQAGYFLIHSSVVCCDDLGVAFMGHKGQGKSAWLLRALAHGWSMIANDRAFVNPGSGDILGLGLAAMLDRASLSKLPLPLQKTIADDAIIRKDHHLEGYKKIGLTPQELSDAYGCQLAARSKLKHLIVLGQKPSSLDPFLHQNIYTPSDPTYIFGLLRQTEQPDLDRGGLVSFLRSKVSFLQHNWNDFDHFYHTRRAPDFRGLLEPFSLGYLSE